MFYFYLSIVVSCALEAIFQIHHRGMQSFIQVFFVGFFMFAGAAYILFQAFLIIVSLFKIATGRVGGWAVTARGKQDPKPVRKSTKEEDAVSVKAASDAAECDGNAAEPQEITV